MPDDACGLGNRELGRDEILGLVLALVLAARHETRRILSLDARAFRAVQPLQGGAFTLLPADR